MKKIAILLFALLCGAFADQVPGVLPPKPKKGQPTNMYSKATARFIQSGAFTADRKEIYSLSGIPEDEEAKKQGKPEFSRPKSADEVSVTLYTADGKKWKAQWVEVKD